MTSVLDASALLAYLEKEPGYEKVRDALTRAAETDRDLLMTTVNWGEVYYILIKHHGLSEADRVIQFINTLPINLVPVGLDLACQAALYKAGKKLAYADSFAAALARLRKTELITADKEFRSVERDIRILWL